MFPYKVNPVKTNPDMEYTVDWDKGVVRARHPRDNGRYCVDCVHHKDSHCRRVEQFFDLVSGKLKELSPYRDCAQERERSLNAPGDSGCGTEGRFYEKKDDV